MSSAVVYIRLAGNAKSGKKVTLRYAARTLQWAKPLRWYSSWSADSNVQSQFGFVVFLVGQASVAIVSPITSLVVSRQKANSVSGRIAEQ